MNENETYAYLSVDGYGKSHVITEILGIEPTREYSEGEPRERVGTHQSMKWMLYSRKVRKGAVHDSLEEHVSDVLEQVEQFKDKLSHIGEGYEKYIQCVAYYYGANIGCGLSSATITRAAALGLGIEFDLYSLGDT